MNPPPTSLLIPSLWVIQCTSREYLVPCIQPVLVSYFTYENIHVSMSFSQIIPPWPTLTESNRLLYICVSFPVVHTGLLLPSLKFYIHALVFCIGVFLSGLLHSYNRLQFHPPHPPDSNVFFLTAE